MKLKLQLDPNSIARVGTHGIRGCPVSVRHFKEDLKHRVTVSLGDVLGLAASAKVGTLLALVVGVLIQNTSVVLVSLLGTTNNSLLSTLSFGDLWCLISDFTITSQ